MYIYIYYHYIYHLYSILQYVNRIANCFLTLIYICLYASCLFLLLSSVPGSPNPACLNFIMSSQMQSFNKSSHVCVLERQYCNSCGLFCIGFLALIPTPFCICRIIRGTGHPKHANSISMFGSSLPWPTCSRDTWFHVDA